jgi:hypothetical protein
LAKAETKNYPLPRAEATGQGICKFNPVKDICLFRYYFTFISDSHHKGIMIIYAKSRSFISS